MAAGLMSLGSVESAAAASSSGAPTTTWLGGAASWGQVGAAGPGLKSYGGRAAETSFAPAASSRARVPSSGDWCDRVAPGPAGEGGRRLAVELSAAHMLVREFAVASPFGVADRALVPALSGQRALTDAGIGHALERYSESLDDVCALRAGHRGSAIPESGRLATWRSCARASELRRSPRTPA
jgi:hypothetical protein